MWQVMIKCTGSRPTDLDLDYKSFESCMKSITNFGFYATAFKYQHICGHSQIDNVKECDSSCWEDVTHCAILKF